LIDVSIGVAADYIDAVGENGYGYLAACDRERRSATPTSRRGREPQQQNRRGETLCHPSTALRMTLGALRMP
jgi:hypothetical protein